MGAAQYIALSPHMPLLEVWDDCKPTVLSELDCSPTFRFPTTKPAQLLHRHSIQPSPPKIAVGTLGVRSTPDLTIQYSTSEISHHGQLEKPIGRKAES